eukprot:gene2718-2968_t
MTFLALFLVILALSLPLATAFLPGYASGKALSSHVAGKTSTTLFSHHPQMKIIKKKMHRRPKKHRPSDINRRNVNLHKCITKIENAPADYTLISAEDFEKVRAEANKFWEEGDPEAEWIEITDEDRLLLLPQGSEAPPKGARKTLNLVRSRTN